jgi:uridine kinase
VTDPGPVVALTLRRPARLGATRLVCVDGPAGSGKTTFAAALVEALQQEGLGTSLVHMDDVYDGWGGLRHAGPLLLREVVGPLARGTAGHYHRYDWLSDRYAEAHEVPPVDVLVVEGVGSAHLGYADRVSVLVWVEAPDDVRLRRGLARDGEELRERWLRWMAEEAALHADERTRDRADVLVDGVAGTVRPAGPRPGPAPAPRAPR